MGETSPSGLRVHRRPVCVLSTLVTLLLAASSHAFNVDTEHAVSFRGESGSMFGFSVSQYRDRQGSWVLVGAPTADSSSYQPDVVRGGAVYRCDVSRGDYCQIVPFDRTGNTRNSSGYVLDRKSNQWFGATVHSSPEDDGAVVACAPRYVFFPNTRDPMEEPVGTCYVARDGFRRITEYAPCRTDEWGYHRQGHCQAGLGASMSKDGERLFIGAPGSWYWQGQVFSQSLENRPDVIATFEGPKEEDDSYLGYSVTSGDFTGEGVSGAAVGMPRGQMLVGKVIMYSSLLQKVGEIIGEQMGAYFGYSICVADMDGDSFDDIVVGAPLFTHLHNNEGKYETGRIYVIYQKTKPNKFLVSHWRDGVNSKSRFGLSVASIGDINKDGYGDIAVGAPYDGTKGGGAIYIYHGSAAGIMKEASQVIFGENIDSRLRTFGFSVAGGLDLDNNQYPDIAVGAYDSDHAIFLKSRPVILMNAEISIGPESKLVSLDDKNCTLRDGTLTTCTPVNICLEYKGIGADPQHEFEVQLVLDAKKPKSPRLFFQQHEGINMKNFTVILNKNSQYCRSHSVYIKPGMRDKLSPLEVEMRYETKYDRRRVQRSLTPVLDRRKPLLEHDSISIQKNCGPDNICIPNLVLTANKTITKYYLGSGEKLELGVKILNIREDAFEATYALKIPPGLNFTRIQRFDKNENEIPIQCSAPSAENNNTLKCDIGNPLPKDKLLHFNVILQPFYKENLKSQYEFVMDVNSTNPEEAGSTDDNSEHFSIPIAIKTNIDVIGVSTPQELYYNTTAYNAVNITRESEIGPQLTHTYTIVNRGPSDIVEAEVYVLWPMYTLAGDPFFYILEQPEVSGSIVCDRLEEVNSRNVQIDHKRKGFDGALHSSQQGQTGSRSSATHSKTEVTVTGDGKSTVTETRHQSSSGGGYYKEEHRGSYEGSTGKHIGGGYTQTSGKNFSENGRTISHGGIHTEEGSYAESSSGSKAVSGGHATSASGQQFGWSDEGQFEGYNVTGQYDSSGKPRKNHRKKVYSSQNYTISWTEDGKPVRHYSNFSVSSSGDGDGTANTWESGDKDAALNFSRSGYDSSDKFHHSFSSSTSSQQSGASQTGNTGTVKSGGGIRFIPAPGFGGAGSEVSSTSFNFEESVLPGSVSTDGELRNYWIQEGSAEGSNFGQHRTLNEMSGSRSGQHTSSSRRIQGSANSGNGYAAGSSENISTGVRKYTSQQWTSDHGDDVRHYSPGTSVSWEEHYESNVGGTSDYDDKYDDEDDDDYYDRVENSETYRSNKDTNVEKQKSEADRKLKLYDRYKREAVNDDEFDQLIQCNSTKCIRLRCKVQKFTKDQEASIQIRSRAWVQTLKKVVTNKPLRVSSLLAMQVTKLPYVGKPYRPIIKSKEVFTDAISTDVPIKPDIVPLWVVVLSACAGVLILLLLILLLWKCGFFKRNRPTDAPEKEPLNRNGHYSNGDEAL